MFAREQKQEYDPTSAPLVERPLAAGRSLNAQSSNLWGRPSDVCVSDALRSPLANSFKSPESELVPGEPQKSPTRNQPSPTKSSLSKNSRYGRTFDPESGTWSEDEDNYGHELPPGRGLHRHAKSVTFDAAPPQVNEYEMTTPDPSSVASGSREGSYESIGDEEEEDDEESGEFGYPMNGGADESFDASLEDTDKTPVVLPEDWRFMSPDRATDDLASTFEDPFETRKPSPTETIQPQAEEVRALSRSDSRTSNGESRPLPPLPPPPALGATRERSASNSSLQATAERVATAQRNFPTPPRPASISKAELQGIGASSMSLEDRLRLMMLQDEEKSPAAKSPAEEQRERRLRRAGSSPDRVLGKTDMDFRIHEDEDAEIGEEEMEIQLPQMIKRESILRKVKSQNHADDYSYSSPRPSPSPERPTADDTLDPDVPIPSLEDRPLPMMADDGTIIKQEDEESEVDQYAIPEMYRHELVSSSLSNGYPPYEDDDDESHYSTDINGVPEFNAPLAEEDSPPTPRASQAQVHTTIEEEKGQNRMSLPQFAALDFSESFSQYMTPSPPVQEPSKSEEILTRREEVQITRQEVQTTREEMQLTREDIRVDKEEEKVATPSMSAMLERPSTPIDQLNNLAYEDEDDRESTPDSVIRHPIRDASEEEEASAVPEPTATIKAPGSRLKTRPSLAPADLQTMAETRRKVSGDRPPIPPVPEKHQNRPSVIPEGDSFFEGQEQPVDAGEGRQVKRKSSLVQLEVPIEDNEERLSLGLDKEFDRLLEAQKVPFASFLSFTQQPSQDATDAQNFQLHLNPVANLTFRKQKGYLMRQNTKLIVASSASHDSSNDKDEVPKLQPRVTKSAGNSPIKASATWTTEPWNGKIRRRSIRQSGGSPMKRPVAANGSVPPLPGRTSNVASSVDNAAAESDTVPELEEFQDGAERGRLFVKVVGVKDLDLPLPRGKKQSHWIFRWF